MFARLAAELERHALDRRRGARGDRPADLGRACEGDLVDVGVLDEPLPGSRAGADDDVDDARRQAGVGGQLGEAQRRQRCQLGRLEHHCVPGGERRPELPRGDRQREVPRRDQRRRRRPARAR